MSEKLEHGTLFPEAVAKLSEQVATPSGLTAAGWADVPAQIRQRAFFMSRVENARLLQYAQQLLISFLRNEVEILPNGERRIKVGGRADFIRLMQAFIEENGISRQGQRGTITDIGSSLRLGLVFDVNVKSAHEYGHWRQGLRPAVLRAFPAQRFIRVVEVNVPRPVHEQNLGEVRLKSDMAFWLQMNARSLGGFGVPWGPWGYNSGCDVEDVDRAEAERLGLIGPGEEPTPPDVAFDEYLRASTGGMSDDMKGKLQEVLPGAKADGESIVVEKPGVVFDTNQPGRLPQQPSNDVPPTPSPSVQPHPGEIVSTPEGGEAVIGRPTHVEHAEEQVIAARIYKAARVRTPAARVTTSGEGHVVEQGYVNGLPLERAATRLRPQAVAILMASVGAGVAADLLLGNLTVLTQPGGITVAEMKPWRTNLAGALRYDASGQRKEFDERVEELAALTAWIEGDQTALSAALTLADVERSVRRLLRHEADILAAAPADLRAVLRARLRTIRAWLKASARK